jgi:hypothetical protein
MRINDLVLKSVGFVVEYIGAEHDSDDYDLEGSGFFVSTPSTARPGHRYGCFVTAKHIARRLEGRPTGVIVNKSGGGVTVLNVIGDRWFVHPTDESVDVAVIPFDITPDIDIISTSTNVFLSPELMRVHNIGVGDEIDMPGLFTYAPGSKRNMPILRHGILAMIPDEPIQVDEGFAEVYLIEAHSIGGISGSPVFIRKTVVIDQLTDRLGHAEALSGIGSKFYLLGLAHGHWDIKESDINKPSVIHDRPRGVNMGIGVVVPAHKILEVINHPELSAMRERTEAKIRSIASPGEDLSSPTCDDK